jgi:U3 small nucleolar RNA-associated protein 14
MPRRISSGPVPALAPRNTKRNSQKSKKRSLNAFAIASAENPEVIKVRRNRLGEPEDDPRDRKRRRPEEEEPDSEDGGPSRKPTKSARFADEDISEGSDSEGNTWRLGHVEEEDDSELDSDEAFGEGDDDRFAHYSFFGSATNQRKAGKKNKHKTDGSDEEPDLNEDESHGDASGDDDSLGSDAVDLAQMLDDYSEEEEPQENEQPQIGDSESESGSEEDKMEEEAVFKAFSDSDEDDMDSGKLTKLQHLVSTLHPTEDITKGKGPEFHESKLPSTSGLVSSEKFDIRDLLDTTSDPQLAKISKRVGDIPKQLKKGPKLAPALPRRQRDRLDRVAANEKAKQTLDRWVDTVKQMRRSDHITFPLQDPEAAVRHGSEHLLPTISSRPLNDLESTINNILEESGLAADEEKDENQNSEYDELPENKASIQEVLAKRNELRRARDLLFREEQRSKRIKKIKSKSYRRVHRKEREKLSALDQDAFAEGDENGMDEEEQEAHDRRRAAERMGAKHRDSKWAKQMKKSGRSFWDDDARAGVTEMARRNEELRRRIAGKEVRDGESDVDESTSSGDEDEGSDHQGEETVQLRSLRRNLDKLQSGSASDLQETVLSSMPFMKRAEATRQAQNMEDIRRLKRELDGKQSSDESDDENIGRKIFGPASGNGDKSPIQVVRGEFEELEGWEDEDGDHAAEIIDPSAPATLGKLNPTTRPYINKAAAVDGVLTAKNSTRRHIPHPNGNGKAKATGEDQTPSKSLPREILSQPDMDGWTTVTYDHRSDDEKKDDSDAESLVSQTEILQRAFAGDDVEDQFEKEKEATMAEEDEKIIDNSLPGWGNWVGEGVSKRELKRGKGRVMTKQEGIKPQDRKDAKLKNVIINQKRLKKNAGYLASTLPFPFTARSEYERSIRMPIGTEWNVKQTFQANTKPRVIVKPGRIVEPMDKPLV